MENPPVHQNQLCSPLEVKLDVKREAIAKVKVQVTLKMNISLNVPGCGLRILIRSVILHILELDMMDALLRRHVLDSIRFNFQSYLRKLCQNLQCRD